MRLERTNNSQCKDASSANCHANDDVADIGGASYYSIWYQDESLFYVNDDVGGT